MISLVQAVCLQDIAQKVFLVKSTHECRCGLNQASMHEMRHSIVRAVSDYVEIEAEEMVDVNISSDPEMGTVYSVAVPVRSPFSPQQPFFIADIQ